MHYYLSSSSFKTINHNKGDKMKITFRFWIHERKHLHSIFKKIEDIDCLRMEMIPYRGEIYPYKNNYGRILLIADEQSQIDNIVPILMNEASISEVLINDEFLQLKNNIIR